MLFASDLPSVVYIALLLCGYCIKLCNVTMMTMISFYHREYSQTVTNHFSSTNLWDGWRGRVLCVSHTSRSRSVRRDAPRRFATALTDCSHDNMSLIIDQQTSTLSWQLTSAAIELLPDIMSFHRQYRNYANFSLKQERAHKHEKFRWMNSLLLDYDRCYGCDWMKLHLTTPIYIFSVQLYTIDSTGLNLLTPHSPVQTLPSHHYWFSCYSVNTVSAISFPVAPRCTWKPLDKCAW